MRGKPLDSLADMDGERFARIRQVLLIEDSADWADAIAAMLDGECGLALTHVDTEDRARAALAAQRFDLLLVDRNLDPGDGLALLTEIRGQGINTPAILMTTMGEERDIVEGLRQGGDDYIVKPPRAAEVRARIAALIRRGDDDGKLLIGPLEINFRYNLARLGSTQLPLKQRELNLLAWIALRSPEAVTMAELLKTLWGYREIMWPDGVSRTLNPGGLVDVTIARLRSALGEAGIGKGFIRSHDQQMDDAEYETLFRIDEEQAKLARSLTRSWSIDPGVFARDA